MKHSKLKYSKKLASQVIELMEQGNTLSQVCEKLDVEGLKPYTILGWRRFYPEFKDEYELAYDSRSALWSDELYTIASAELPPFDNKLELTAEVQRRRFQIDVLKTILNKHRPTAVAPPSKQTSSKSSDTKQELHVNLPSYDQAED